jgi:hypothetical protein
MLERWLFGFLRGLPSRENAQLLPLFLLALLFGVAAAAHTSEVRMPVFAMAALIALWAWLDALSWRRAMLDTPTSRVGSAAQGFVELVGAGQPVPGLPLLSPVTHLPCLWYRYRIERRQHGEWRLVDQAESGQPFVLDDGSGRCEIDPAGALILTSHKEVRIEGDQRLTEFLLLPGNRLYVLGDFVSFSSTQIRLDRRVDVGNLLADWKEDGDALQQRFDRDGNGSIDEAEWQLARSEAEREIDHRHRELRNQPMRHRLQKPVGRKPFLIANHAPDKLGRRYSLLGLVYLALLLLSLAAIAWLASLPA